MVQTRPKKSLKYTYAERVLGAYSQAQKERRKSSVHIATLRANVRKFAESRKEKLGPQWTNWVGRAVHKLEDQGILKPVDSSGHVSLTEEGKKAVTVARRKVFGTSTSQETTPDEEELLWCSVTEQFSPATHISGARRRLSAPSVTGRKRRQSVRIRSATGCEEEEEEEGPSVSMCPTPWPKRRRVTGAEVPARTPHKPLSKMNKAELKAELRALQSKVLASQMTTPTATQQIPDPETQKLRKKLEDARNELATFRRRSGLIFGEPDEGLTDIEDEEMTSGDIEGATSPGAVLTTPTPIRTRPSRSSILGVMRTGSGSLIPGVSGRPTPAPSEGEHLWDQGNATHDMEDHGDVSVNTHVDGGDTGAGGQVISPDLTPTRQGEDEVLREKIAAFEASVNANINEIADLRADLAHRDESLASLAEKEIAIRELQNELTAKDEGISELQTTVSAKDSTIAEKDIALAEYDALLSMTRDALAHKEASLAELRSVLQEAVVEKDRTLEETIVSKDIIIFAKTESINQLQAALTVIQAEATQLTAHIRTLEQTVRASEAELQLTRQQHSGQIERMVETIGAKDAKLAARTDEVLQKDIIIEQANARLDAANMEMTRIRETVEELTTRLTTTQMQAAETAATQCSSLEKGKAEKQVLIETISVLQSEKAAVEAQSKEFRGQVVGLSRDLQTSYMEHAAAKTTILGLLGTVDELSSLRDEEVRMSSAAKEALSIVEAEARQLRDQVHDAEMEIQQCRGELAKGHVALLTEQTSASMLRSQLTVTRTDLDAARSALEIAKEEVVDAKEELAVADDEVQALRAAKKADEGIIKELKGIYERLRKAQGEWMNELNKITLTQSTSVPEPRRKARHNMFASTSTAMS
ncbi:hypothetical protein BS17DRAFT_777657 [Gyrodon lividus]|nr:hypothetical protein BS17DRAFT_777657 [Gyrodon lividus]